MSREKWYDMYVAPAGHIKEERGENAGFGWRANLCDGEPRCQSDLRNKVLVTETGVYITNEVLGMLIETNCLTGPRISFGRRKLFKLTSTIVEEAVWKINYPARNEREQEVSSRNDDLLCWLIAQDDFRCMPRGIQETMPYNDSEEVPLGNGHPGRNKLFYEEDS